MRKNVLLFDYAQVLEELAGPESTALPAYNTLYAHVSPRLYAYAKKILKRKDLAEDLVQEIFISIWTKRTQLKQVNNFQFWLFGAIKKGALKVLQNALNAEVRALAHADKLSRQEDPLKEARSRHLEEMIEQLPHPRKQMFQLAKIEGKDASEVALHFNTSVDMVWYHVSKAMKFIQKNKRDILGLLLFINVLLE